MAKNDSSVPLKYLTKLSIKELSFNYGSTIQISAVVAFIVLPLLLLSTFGRNFLLYMKDDMERTFDLRRIQVIIGNPSRDSIKPEDIKSLSKRDDVSFVQPIRTRGVQIVMNDESLEDYEANATSEGDPSLKRIGFSGIYQQSGNWLIIHEDYAKKVKKDPSTGEVSLIVSSISASGRSREYAIPFKIAGTYSAGGGRSVYLPLELMDRFDNWRLGYPVPEWNLPGRENQEDALGQIYYTSVRIFLPYKITDREKKNLSLAKYNYKIISRQLGADSKTKSDSKDGLEVSRRDTRIMNDFDVQTVKDVVISAGTAIVVPEPDQINVVYDGKPLNISSSTEHDPWQSGLLVKGGWLKKEGKLPQFIIPAAVSQSSKVIPSPAATQGEGATDLEVAKDDKTKSSPAVSQKSKVVLSPAATQGVTDPKVAKDDKTKSSPAVSQKSKVVPSPAATQGVTDPKVAKDDKTKNRAIGQKDIQPPATEHGVAVPKVATGHTEKQKTFPYVAKIKVGDQEILVEVQGICQGSQGFAHPRTVYRLAQVAKGKAIHDGRTGEYSPVTKTKEYVAALVYADKTEQVHSLEHYLRKEHDFVTDSYGPKINKISIIGKRINILVTLLAITGFFAVIFATAGTMAEAVRRKRRAIGLMRTMGVPRRGIAYFFLFQALSYGVLGIFFACTSQLLVCWIFLERQWLYDILKADPSKHLFWPSAMTWIYFALITIFICVVAGVRPAISATKIEPGEILSNAE